MRRRLALLCALGTCGLWAGAPGTSGRVTGVGPAWPRALCADEPPASVPGPPTAPAAQASPGSTAPGTPAPAAPPAERPPALDGGLSLTTLAHHVLPSVLLVEVRSPGRARQTRHAVVVDAAGWLVLAGPTLGPADVLQVRLGPDRMVPAVPVGRDARTALTLLQLPQIDAPLKPILLPEVAPRKPLPAGPEVGARVVMVTGMGAVARGSVRALERTRTMVDAAQGTTELATGLIEAALASVSHDVGAPWVDSQGRCVGLLVGGVAEDPLEAEEAPSDLELRPEPVAAHAVPATVVALVWPLLRDRRSVDRSRLGVQARPAGEALRRHVCGGCGGQEILQVDAGGPAAIAGVQPEDLLLAIDGVALRANASLADTLLPYRPLDTVTLTLLRRGDKLERQVVLAPR